VGYEETFVSGAGGDGSYVCLLTIAAQKLELLPGGPARAFTPPAARDYATLEPTMPASGPTQQHVGGGVPVALAMPKGNTAAACTMLKIVAGLSNN
jgi:hypothetical protein